MKVVLVTGGFDPLHSGHIEYFNAAKSLGDILVVGVNSDSWLSRKKGKPFMTIDERVTVIQNLKMVDHCILFNDNDNTAIEAINNIKMLYPESEIIFANGGDRTETNIPEMVFNDVKFVFGVGGTDKKNSSSWILDEWKAPKVLRVWGYYRVLYDIPGCKVKELIVEPGKKLSMQKHKFRSEFWTVSDGNCEVFLENSKIFCTKHSNLLIPNDTWHQLTNPFDIPCKIIEIQYGTDCNESDIERR